MPHIKFPSIEQFNTVYHTHTYQGIPISLELHAKIKLHGTNAAIRIETDGSVTAQSNEKDLTIDADNDGFAAFLAENSAPWSSIAGLQVLTFYGEWAGPKIAKGDAIQRTDKQRFFIFALGVGRAEHFKPDSNSTTSEWMITCPEAIASFLPEGIDTDLIRVLPFENEEPIVFNFADDEQISQVLKFINESVEGLDVKDPYVSRTFGIDHPGEGFVILPFAEKIGELTLEGYARRSFKAKTEKHRVRKQGKPAAPREPLPQNAIDFVETFCTIPRMEQARQVNCPGRPQMQNMGKLIKWMISDIVKEAGPEIEALPVEFRKVSPLIATKTREWYEGLIKDSYPKAAE